jgi:hydroxymethylbilane synthase
MAQKHTIRLGTRGSRLAMIQAEMAANALKAAGAEVEFVEITTSGDTDRRDLWEIGGQGVFTAAIEEALLARRIDAAVHSAKDLPTKLAAGLKLAAALPREDPRDALVSPSGLRLAELPPNAIVGTSSTRRAAAILAARPDLATTPIRGNVPTRVEKVLTGEYAAAVLAVAGLKRLGLEKAITEVFETDIIMPAAGQGAIVIEIRSDDDATTRVVEAANDAATLSAVTAERAVLAGLAAGCRTPVGALAIPVGDGFVLSAAVLTADGQKQWRAGAVYYAGDEEVAGIDVARSLLENGAGEALSQEEGSCEE